MALLWMGFAFVVGPGTSPPGHGVVGVVAGVLAGWIVLVPFGVVLGLLGGRWNETLIGGCVGLTVGAVAALFAGHTDVLLRATTCLVAGGLIGATFPGMLRRAKATALTLASLWLRLGARAEVTR